ncbi:hypothetical protein XELAEV_18009582mg [Xenopus laevis]|uniref:Tyr recombinase domain-containing protein n=1 Tax=Xenopus laevis TaxID=8355 RepID=A0A974DV19_XENLA|nr:hypothetical protein XELAEV_18009582mg [Xenopus laevis]
MKRWARRMGGSRDVREPLTRDRLEALVIALQHVYRDVFELYLFKAAFCIAYHRTLQIIGLQMDQVKVSQSVVLWFIGSSKTDQMSKESWVSLKATRDLTCPLKAVQEYLSTTPEGQMPLLVHQDGSSLTIFQLRAILKIAVLQAGFSNFRITRHSFRIGPATEAG